MAMHAYDIWQGMQMPSYVPGTSGRNFKALGTKGDNKRSPEHPNSDCSVGCNEGLLLTKPLLRVRATDICGFWLHKPSTLSFLGRVWAAGPSRRTLGL